MSRFIDRLHSHPLVVKGSVLSLVLWLVCFFLLGSDLRTCSAQYMHVTTEGCSDQSGVFAYLFVQGEVRHLSVVKCSSNTVQLLFTKSLSSGVTPPICLPNAIIVVGFDGRVSKYSLDGEEEFSVKLLGPDEVSRLSGRWDAGTVYMTAMKYEGSGADRKPHYRCLWVDVRGKKPILKGEVEIGAPIKLLRVEDDIVICGPINSERKRAPTALQSGAN